MGGVAVEWGLGPRLAPEELGSLVRSDLTTGADGTARALYKAPLLEARNMQEVGERKGRDIAVDYRAGEQKGSRMATLTLLKTASADLVVEKPGLSPVAPRDPHRQPQRQHPGHPEPARLAPAELAVDEPGAAQRRHGLAREPDAQVGGDREDHLRREGPIHDRHEDGELAAADLSLREAILLDPDQEFTARQTRFASSLARWPASTAVKQQALPCSPPKRRCCWPA